MATHRQELDARLAQGDEDSLVHLWLYGTSFTRRPPARREHATDANIAGRLVDLGAAVASPGSNARVLFARAFFARAGLDPGTQSGRDAIGRRLEAARRRGLDEFARTDAQLAAARRTGPTAELAAHSRIFDERGLSSDTSLLINFAVDEALATARAGGLLAPGTVRRAAVIGPGLDFINKAEGRDDYPEQTLQPFALIDSLQRLDLADRTALRVTTFDVSRRVNHHLAEALQNAAAGHPYSLHATLARGERWLPPLVNYRDGFALRIGVAPVDSAADRDGVRTIAVAPAFVRVIEPRDLDIVTEYLQTTALFDLVIATNVFVYYDPIRQAHAMANVARMLRPGGLLLSNTDVAPSAAMHAAVGHLSVRYSDRQVDHMFVYQRK